MSSKEKTTSTIAGTTGVDGSIYQGSIWTVGRADSVCVAGHLTDRSAEFADLSAAFDFAEYLAVQAHHQTHGHHEVGQRGGQLEGHRVAELGLAYVPWVFAHSTVVPLVPACENKSLKILDLNSILFY